MSTGTLAHADIFFFVTTISVVLLTAALLVAFFYVVKFLEQGRRTLAEVEEHVGDASEDIKDMLYDLRESAMYRFLFRRKRKRSNGQG